MYGPGVAGAVALQVYDPSVWVVTVTTVVFQLKTHTIGSLPPSPFGVSVPETVNGAPPPIEFGVANAVSEVEMGLVSEPVLRFNEIVPGPMNVTRVGSLDPEQVRPFEQLQVDNV